MLQFLRTILLKRDLLTLFPVLKANEKYRRRLSYLHNPIRYQSFTKLDTLVTRNPFTAEKATS